MAITSILNHTLCTGHVVTDENFKIIATGGTSKELEIKETLMINKLKPTLNIMNSSTELHLFK